MKYFYKDWAFLYYLLLFIIICVRVNTATDKCISGQVIVALILRFFLMMSYHKMD